MLIFMLSQLKPHPEVQLPEGTGYKSRWHLDRYLDFTIHTFLL